MVSATPAQAEARSSRIDGSKWWGLYAPALLVLICALLHALIVVETGYCLCAFALALIVLIARSRSSSVQEKVTWAALALIFCAGEIAVAFRSRTATQNFAVCSFPASNVALLQQHGPATLRSLAMVVVNQEELDAVKASHTQNSDDYYKIYQFAPAGVLAPGGSRTFALKTPRISATPVHYRVQMSADNGAWWEDYQAISMNGRAVSALRIMRYMDGKPRVLFEDDGSYPHAENGRVGWAWASQVP